ncbi:MAG: cytochrome c [Acidobacteriia bacterium]|nr:cytochrome c [Terriglobia bacterium]
MTATDNRLRPPLRQCRAILLLCAAVVISIAPGVRAQTSAGGYFIPGDPKAGMKSFFEKGCGRCHSVLGEGGRTAPDLARAPAGYLSSAEMLAAMWNHAPAMWEKMRVEHVPPPHFSEAEMANLFAFLSSVRSLDEPGDPQRGKQLLSEKKCLECHSVAGRGGHVGPDLRNWASYRNPVSWIQAMWNHAPAMQGALAARGYAWPRFEGNDVADLIAYIRTLAPNSRKKIYVRAADAEAGARIFQQKGCLNCHAVGGKGGGRAPDLGTRTFPRTLGQFAGLMWNHAPRMRASMQAQQVSRPEFSNKEMADLISYLFVQRYFEVSGNAARGRRVYLEKGCGACHTLGSGTGKGPDLTRSGTGAAPISIATALWNHGPMMLETMHQEQVAWPRFQPGEIVDLLEFLNRARSAPLQAGVRR